VGRNRRRIGLGLLCAAALATGVACGDDDETSPASLKPLLVPESQLRLALEHPFEWDNAIDFTVEGINLPQSTRPSDAIEEIEDAGFDAGYGQFLGPGDVHVAVAKFDGDDGATEARDYLHQQDLQQPCFGACSVDPQEFEVSGIPNLKGVHLVPRPRSELPADAPPPFEAFTVEFTIGPYLYYVNAGGGPGEVPEERFTRGVKTVYEYARRHTD
jgi:hypothetical protein